MIPDDLKLVGEPSPELDKKCKQEIKAHLEIDTSTRGTYVVAVAVHKEQGKNELRRIPLRYGKPIAGYIYEHNTDSYLVECYEMATLGMLPVSFVLRMPGVGEWKQPVPMPEQTVRHFLTVEQRHGLKLLEKVPGCVIHLLQFLDG